MSEAFASLVEAFKNVGVSRAYGTPVQIAGEEIIPVALVSFGFGGGSNPDAGNGGDGAAGGGGGGFVLPLGVYGRGPRGHMVFRPNTLALLAVLVPLVCAVGVVVRGVARTVKA
ncbi:hypothetical protein E5206_13535 [Arthrobacter sp. PAMC25564]|uniref:hypothetical protein n=1 Tax=Arthrobacter sp. PAMC25564 TaxID=2565366 RepID=UPI0010A26819|nr:hypothetical protein [Arthrobacter sp. PAMC25564]QCB97810.1 hypothetical protein E5206_13535 [Arthrobacter sp. PAMC25564]